MNHHTATYYILVIDFYFYIQVNDTVARILNIQHKPKTLSNCSRSYDVPFQSNKHLHNLNRLCLYSCLKSCEHFYETTLEKKKCFNCKHVFDKTIVLVGFLNNLHNVMKGRPYTASVKVNYSTDNNQKIDDNVMDS